MLTILHTGDIHLGAKFSKLGIKGDEQRVQLQKTFEKIVDIAIEKKVNLFVISGDLFDSNNPDKGLIDFVLSCLEKLNSRNIYTVISFGTHDYMDSKKLDVKNLSYVRIFDGDQDSFVFDDLSLKIFCNCADSNKISKSPIEGIKRDDKYKYNIALAHGSLNIPGKTSLNDSPFSLEEIESSGMDYIALGHWHNQQEVGKGRVKAWYCGSPEMIDLDQDGSGKILLVSISDNNEVRIESIKVGVRDFDSIKIDVTGMTSMESLIYKIREKSNPALVRNVQIDGILNLDFGIIDVNEIMKRLKDEFFYLIINNNSHFSVKDIGNVEGNVLKTKFIENLKSSGKDEKILDDAMQLGLMLIDGTTKVY